MVKEYKDMPFPWVSKSKIKTRAFCGYSFWLQYIKHEKRMKRADAVEGTNMHMVFAKFFQEIQQKHMFKSEFCDVLTPIRRHPLRRFIYEACMRWVKPDQRKFDKYKNILRNFATIETKRWLYLNVELRGRRDEIFSLFKPIHIEKRLNNELTHMFGTIDRVNIELLPNHTKKICVYDYKTGNVPISVQRHVSDTLRPYDWKLPPASMLEIHFYGLLYLLEAGWQLNDEVLDFINNPDWWYVKKDGMSYKQTLAEKKKYLTGLGKKYRIFKPGKVFKQGDILVGYYFLNGEKAYKPIKEFNYTSYKTVLSNINDLRTIQYNNYYVKHPRYIFNKDICVNFKKCDRAKQCEQEVRGYLESRGE